MKKLKLLGAGFLALSSLLLSSYADGRGAGNGSYSQDNSPYGGSTSSSANQWGYSSNGSKTNYGYMGRGYGDNNSNGGYSSSTTTSTTTMTKKQPGGPNTGGSCGNHFDMNLFEGQDEQDAYSAYGYTRGDVYNVYRNKFDPNTVVSVGGMIEKVIRVQYPDGDCYLVAIISTQEGDLLVNLGPVNYFDSQRIVLSEGDTIQVRGSKIRINGRFVLIGMDLNRDGKVLPLRNEAGQPAWKAPGEPGGTTNTNIPMPPRTPYRSNY